MTFDGDRSLSISADPVCGTLNHATPRQVVLVAIRKQVEQARERTSVRNIPSWLLFQFLPPDSRHELLS